MVKEAEGKRKRWRGETERKREKNRREENYDTRGRKCLA